MKVLVLRERLELGNWLLGITSLDGFPRLTLALHSPTIRCNLIPSKLTRHLAASSNEIEEAHSCFNLTVTIRYCKFASVTQV